MKQEECKLRMQKLIKYYGFKPNVTKTNKIMETLEEAAKNYNLNTINAFGDYESFIAGAKWQQERSYSEEEVEDIMAETWIQCVGNDGNNFKKARNKILKQFKKK
jgi:hypothetical protein